VDEDLEKRKRKRKIRRILLNKILKAIESGELNNKEETDFNLSNPLGGARRQYYSPVERNTSNYGYAEQHEVNKG
jgi:hypothetical protein